MDLGPKHPQIVSNTRDLFGSLFDDAAIFPPGNKALDQAVVDHVRLAQGDLAALLGSFVVSDSRIDDLGKVATEARSELLPLSVTVRHPSILGQLRERLSVLNLVDQVLSLEMVIPNSVDVDSAIAQITHSANTAWPGHVDVYIEVPRNNRRHTVLAAISRSPFRAKFRTGGTEAALYPSSSELAESILSAVQLGIAFKATAGLHHAIRNRDPVTGFEQHGFLNVMMAVEACLAGSAVQQVAEILDCRNGDLVARWAHGLLTEKARSLRHFFRAFGTCSIAEPVGDLVSLGLLEAVEAE